VFLVEKLRLIAEKRYGVNPSSVINRILLITNQDATPISSRDQGRVACDAIKQLLVGGRLELGGTRWNSVELGGVLKF